MQFTISAAELEKTVSSVQNLVSNSEITLRTKGKDRLYVEASKDGKILSRAVPAIIEAKGSITIESSLLLPMIRKKKELQFTLADGALNFASADNKYKGEMKTLDTVPVERPEVDKDTPGLSMDETTLKFLTDVIPHIYLRNVYTNTPMFVCISYKKKRGLRAGVYDGYHMAYARDTKLVAAEEFSISIQLQVLETILALMSDGNLSILVSETRIVAFDDKDTIYLSYPTMANVHGEQSVESLESMLSELKKDARSYSCVLRQDEFISVLNNTVSILDSTSNLRLTTSKTGLSLSIKTELGSVSAQLEVETLTADKETYEAETKLLLDTMECVPSGGCTLSIVKDKMIEVTAQADSTNLYYASMLS